MQPFAGPNDACGDAMFDGPAQVRVDMGATGKELRTVIDHLLLIKAHLRSLVRCTERLGQEGYTPESIMKLSRGFLDVQMVIEERMLLSVSAHERSGREVAKPIRTAYRADKKMSTMRQLNPRFFLGRIDIQDSQTRWMSGS
ncbi:hypothetical protein [Sphingomonas bacterium]|uniref:hypothetical protein n=1 Tax=Sphingomonas bacterium TaxID=1895847 RepID=UPI001575179C|nr:hypothetical protein [Sphingomonas bacterium]